MRPALAPNAPSRASASSARRASSRLASSSSSSSPAAGDAFDAFVPRRRARRTPNDAASVSSSVYRIAHRDSIEDASDRALEGMFKPVVQDAATKAALRAARREDEAAYLERKARRDERIEKCRLVIVVEGGADVRAVRMKANVSKASAKVVAIRHRGAFARAQTGEMDIKRERMDEIEAMSEKYDAPIVVLFDADTAGRQLRNAFLKRFPRATHAFLGAHASSAKADGKWHAAGNVGVEHGEGKDILLAIANAREAKFDRREFARDDLATWGLVDDDASATLRWAPYGGVVNRRRLVGEHLGVGDCDGRQLLRQMNLFFTADEVRIAIEALPLRDAPIPPKMTDGFADRASRSRRSANVDADVSPNVQSSSNLGFDPMAYIPPGKAPPGFH